MHHRGPPAVLSALQTPSTGSLWSTSIPGLSTTQLTASTVSLPDPFLTFKPRTDRSRYLFCLYCCRCRWLQSSCRWIHTDVSFDFFIYLFLKITIKFFLTLLLVSAIKIKIFLTTYSGHNVPVKEKRPPCSAPLSLEQSECSRADQTPGPVVRRSRLWKSLFLLQGVSSSLTKQTTTSMSTRSSNLWLCCGTTALTRTYVQLLVFLCVLFEQLKMSGAGKKTVKIQLARF